MIHVVVGRCVVCEKSFSAVIACVRMLNWRLVVELQLWLWLLCAGLESGSAVVLCLEGSHEMCSSPMEVLLSVGGVGIHEHGGPYLELLRKTCHTDGICG